ncbi:MAG TPA: hypothetical protein VER96_39985 [Polyangiaceae bacterium]|nr:hypothetical protein [Polyangiaceae bacterium]
MRVKFCAASFGQLLPLLLMFGCSRKETSQATPVPTVSASAPSTTAAPPATAAQAQATSEGAVDRWNDLHRARDAQGLAAIYADKVEFYGQQLPKQRVLAMKASAFEKAPDFTQSVSGLKITKPSADRARAEFTKSWTQGGKTSTTTAVLELSRTDGSFKVTKETDGPSEARKNAAAEGGCEKAIIDLVLHTEPAKGMLMSPMPADVRMGMRFGSEPPEQPVYSVAVHEVHEDHLATLAWYDVDPKTGTMSESGTETHFQVDPTLAQKVVAACK